MPKGLLLSPQLSAMLPGVFRSHVDLRYVQFWLFFQPFQVSRVNVSLSAGALDQVTTLPE
jgi:hypothetical protein